VRKKYPLVLLIDLTDIYRGALAAVVGAASMVQPELLPGAVAIVGKMASDAAKKTVINIATTEGKKVGAAIGKDISKQRMQVQVKPRNQFRMPRKLREKGHRE
jgi:hypothetical protein